MKIFLKSLCYATVSAMFLSIGNAVLAQSATIEKSVAPSATDKTSHEKLKVPFVMQSKTELLEEQAVVENNPKTIKSAYEMQRLAFTLEHNYRDVTAARDLYQKALAIFDQEMGLESPQSIPILTRLGRMCMNSKEPGQSEEYFKRALKSAEVNLGPNDSRLGKLNDELAEFYRGQKNWTAAEAAQKKAILIYDKAFEANALDSATAQNQLSETYFRQKKFNEAEQPLLESIVSYKMTMGPNSILIAALQDSLADVYMKEKKYSDAEKSLNKSLSIKEAALGSEGEYLVTTLNRYALLKDVTGHAGEASSYRSRAESIDRLYSERNRTGIEQL